MTRRAAYGVTPNYALERSVTALSVRAAGACRDFAPTARWRHITRPARRGR